MVKRSLDYVIKRAKESDKIIIVGAGKRGKEILDFLKKEELREIGGIFDNNEAKTGRLIENIPVTKPFKVNANCIYIIAVDKQEYRNEFRNQLLGLGIEKNYIIIYYSYRDYEYLSNLKEAHYEEEIKEMYYEEFGKILNWDNPVTYNEKINWEKLNIKDARRTQLVDKYLVREWVKGQIGEKHLTKLWKVWDDANEIEFEQLPDQFVLKLNNGSGRNIIVTDKSRIDQKMIREQLEEWKKSNFAFQTFEMQYKNVVPKIICEEYLEGVAESVYDYNIYCFHGEPEYIWCIKGSHRPGCQASFYNKDWELQPFSYGYPKDPVLAPRPEKLDEMLELSRVLSKDFQHVRVDWYNLPDGRVLFGEMTFSTWSGLMHFEPEKYDTVFGSLI